MSLTIRRSTSRTITVTTFVLYCYVDTKMKISPFHWTLDMLDWVTSYSLTNIGSSGIQVSPTQIMAIFIIEQVLLRHLHRLLTRNTKQFVIISICRPVVNLFHVGQYNSINERFKESKRNVNNRIFLY